MTGEHTVLIRLADRCIEGDDMAQLIRENFDEDADIRARLDATGRLQGYDLRLVYPSREQADAAAVWIQQTIDNATVEEDL